MTITRDSASKEIAAERKRKKSTVKAKVPMKKAGGPKKSGVKRVVFEESESDEDIGKYQIQSVGKSSDETMAKVWMRYIPDAEIAFNTLNFYGSPDKFETAAQFTTSQREMFSQTCFGKFLQLPKLTKSSKIINHLIMRTGHYKNEERNDVIFIDIGGKVRSFSQKDFAAITGLRFSDRYKSNEYALEQPDSVFAKVFKNGNLRKRDFLGVLLESSKQLSDEARTKFLLIYFLATVLLVDSKNVSVETSYIRMVDDLDTFNNYPWGNVVWDYMFQRVRSTIAKESARVTGGGGGQGKTLNVAGFFLPLQIWAYETMPIFFECNFYELVAPDATPLMLRWAGSIYLTEKSVASINLGGLKTAGLIWSYSPTKEGYQMFMISLQRLRNPG